MLYRKKYEFEVVSYKFPPEYLKERDFNHIFKVLEEAFFWRKVFTGAFTGKKYKIDMYMNNL